MNLLMNSVSIEPPITIDHGFYADHAPLFEYLCSSVAWDASMAARKTASFGMPYNYSQMRYAATPIPAPMEPLHRLLCERLGIPFNNCLLNYYETGEKTMGFHSDDTTGLVPRTGVAIVSLGSMRHISFRSIETPSAEVAFPLAPGSLLYMDEAVQKAWTHAIKREKGAGPRISMTWRAVRETHQPTPPC